MGLGGDWRHLNPDGRGPGERKAEMPARETLVAWPRCLGWEGKKGPSALGQLPDPEMRVKEGMWSIWEVQGCQ